MQKISPIHRIILKIQQILESWDLKYHTYFWSPLSNYYQRNFWLSWIFHNIPKISLFHWFLLDIQPILVSLDQRSHTHFWPFPSLGFSITVWFSLISISTHKKSGLFIILFWRYSQLKNPATWLAKCIWPISQEPVFSQVRD